MSATEHGQICAQNPALGREEHVKFNTAELTGSLFNHFVEVANGFRLEGDGSYFNSESGLVKREASDYLTEPDRALALGCREKIYTYSERHENGTVMWRAGKCATEDGSEFTHLHTASTPQIAVVRSLIESKLGTQVSIDEKSLNLIKKTR